MFPTTLDDFTPRVDNVNDVMAADVNDLQTAIEALEAKVGIDASAVTGSLDYLIKSAANPGHTHTAYEPADATILKSAAIGVSIQAYDADLAAIAALTPSNDDILQFKAGAWTNRTIANLITDLGLGSAAYVATTAFAAALGGDDNYVTDAEKTAIGTIGDKVDKSLFDAYTVLYADTDNTPAALTVSANTVIGRIGAGIVAIAIDSDLSSVSANDDTVPSAKATKAYADLKMTNPMNAAGDIIYGGVSGAATRLAKGADGKVLTLVSGAPSWETAAGGVTINTLTEKTIPVDADLFLIEDSAASNAQKKLTLLNILKRTLSFTASDDLLVSADTEQTNGAASWTKYKEIRVDYPGTYRIKYDLRTNNAGNTARGNVYKNGSPVGTQRDITNTSYQNFSEDFVLAKGDLIQLYSFCSNTSYLTYVRNFRVYGAPGTAAFSAGGVIIN